MLAAAIFVMVLDGIGQDLGLERIAGYHLAFMRVSDT